MPTTPNLANWSQPRPLAERASEPPGLCAWDRDTVFALHRKGNEVMRWGRVKFAGPADGCEWKCGQAVGRTQGRPALVRVGDDLCGFYQSGSNDDLWQSTWRPFPAGASPAVPGVAVASAWRERRLDFKTRGAPAAVADASGALLLLPTEHGLAWSGFSSGGFSLPEAIAGISLRNDRVVPSAAILDGAVHLVLSVRNHRNATERALEVLMPGLGTALTTQAEKLAPHWRRDGSTWTLQQSGFQGIASPSPVGLAGLGGRLHMVLRGASGDLGWYFTEDGRWKHGGQVGRSDDEPSLVSAGDRLVMFTTAGEELVMQTYRDDAAPRLERLGRPPGLVR